MILVDGEKYACEQCIRGHRSSTCKHIQRPLVLVRSRGRPSTDSFQRIAIFAEEIKDDEEKNKILRKETNLKKKNSMPAKFISDRSNNDEVDKKIKSSCCSTNSKLCALKAELPIPPIKSEILESPSYIKTEVPVPLSPIKSQKPSCVRKETLESEVKKKLCSCCSTTSNQQGCKKKNRSVFVLKAAKRQVYNVEKDSLRLLDPVVEIPNSKVGLEIIQKVSKHKKMHSCRNKRIKEDLLQALKSLNGIESNSSCCSSNAKNEYPIQPKTNSSMHQFRILTGEQTKNVGTNLLNETATYNQKQNSNTINEIQHNINIQNPDLFYGGATTEMNTSTSSKLPNLHQNNTDIQQANSFLYDFYIADSCTVPGSCTCEPDKCSCPDCTEHGKFKNSNLSVKQQFEQFQFPVGEAQPLSLINSNDNHKSIRPYGKVEIQSTIPQFEQTFLKLLNEPNNNDTNIARDETISQSSEISNCYCEADKCCCFNCVDHGIVNGIRISDGSSILDSQLPYEIQLKNSQFPIDEMSPSSTLSTTTELPNSEVQNLVENDLNSNIINLSDKERWLENHYSQQFAPVNRQGALFPEINGLSNPSNNPPMKINNKGNCGDINSPEAADHILALMMNHHHIAGSKSGFDGPNNDTNFISHDSIDYNLNFDPNNLNSCDSGFRN